MDYYDSICRGGAFISKHVLFKHQTEITLAAGCWLLTCKRHDTSLLLRMQAVARVAFGLYFIAYSLKSYRDKKNYLDNIEIKEEQIRPGDRIAYIVKATEDHNGIFTLNPTMVQNFTLLSQKYRVLFQLVSTPDEIVQGMKKIAQRGGKINVLWIQSHATPHRIALGEEDLTAFTLRHSGLATALSKLEPGGTLVLDGCATSGEPFFGDNIAATIAKATNQWRVFGATIPIPFSSTLLESLEPLTVTFRDFPDLFPFGRALGLGTLLGCPPNITQVHTGPPTKKGFSLDFALHAE